MCTKVNYLFGPHQIFLLNYLFVYFQFSSIIVFVWSDKLAQMRTIEQRPCFAPEIKIMWEEQLVVPPIDYKKSLEKPFLFASLEIIEVKI